MTALENLTKDLDTRELTRKGSKVVATTACTGAAFGAVIGALTGAAAGLAAWSALTVSREAWNRYRRRD